MPALIYTVTWCAIVGAIVLAGMSAVRFIIYGSIVDLLCMCTSTVCLCILVALVTE